jgi:VanZ family protein
LKLQTVDKLLAAWIIIVFIGIALPGKEFPDINQMVNFDKIVHMILFGVVTFLMNGSLILKGFSRKSAAIISLLAGAAYAGLAEIIQLFVPGRTCSIYDFYAGVIGAIIALAVIHFIKFKPEI